MSDGGGEFEWLAPLKLAEPDPMLEAEMAEKRRLDDVMKAIAETVARDTPNDEPDPSRSPSASDVEAAETENEDVEESAREAAVTRGVPLSHLVPAEAWQYHRESRVVIEDPLADLDERAMREHGDEILFYRVGGRLAREYADALTDACGACGSCPKCFEREDLATGRRSVELKDVTDLLSMTWVWDALAVTADTRHHDGVRIFRMANKNWDKGRKEIVEPRLRRYLLTPEHKKVASERLVRRIRCIAEDESRTRR